MAAADDASSQRRDVLDPTDRFSEVVFGIIMSMSFTATVHVANAGEQSIRELLYAAVGCNVAWGFVDAVMYVITTVSDRGWAYRLVREISDADDADGGRRIVVENLPGGLADMLPPSVLEGIRTAIADDGRNARPPRVARGDLAGALGVFLLVVLGTLPVALPFAFLSDVTFALRVSQGIGLAMLFANGVALGHYAGFRAWRSGVAMLAIGVALVGVIVALGA
ncbi:MAG TPA: VIT1/CCC1 transporter family protein [Vicinamibacterales bacterium]|nr:VIT1/CCC1 transporter family protein [Vicinamibacterales bacterium]